MIKYIKIHGLKALTKDIEIELDDNDKYVLIIGPNGSGKTTLLRHITTPLAQSSGLNMVRDGYDEAYKEIVLEYRGNTYKIRHVYRKGKSLSTNSYIAKLIDGEYIELCENGLVTNFKDIIARELEYYDYYNELLNIGITNHGIVTMTDSNKLEYIKRIYNNKELDTMKENVSKHHSFLNNKLKIEKDKLSKYNLLKTYEDELGILTNRKNTSLSNLNANKTLLKNLLGKYNKENHDKMRSERESYHHLYKESKYIRDYTQHEESVSDFISNLKTKLSESKIKLENCNNNILQYNKDRQNFLNVNENNERRVSLQKEYDNLNTNDPLYKHDPIQINKCIYILENVEDNRYNIPDLSYMNIYNVLSKYKNLDEVQNKIRESKINLQKERETFNNVKKDYDEINYDNLLTSLKPKEGCKVTDCGLLNEWNKQIKNQSIKKTKSEDLDKYTKKISLLESKIKDIEWDYEIYKTFEVNDDIFKEVLDTFYIDIIKMNNVSNILETLKKIQFKLKDKSRMNDIEKELDILTEIEESVTKDRISELNIKIEKEIENKRVFMDSIDTYEHSIQSYSKIMCFDKNLLSYDKKKIKEVTEEYLKKVEILDTELSNYETNAVSLRTFEDVIKSEEENIEDINNRMKDIEFKILAVRELEEECKQTSSKLQDISVLRQIVNKLLPSRVLSNLINDIENDVNRLLEGFMQIEFDKTDNGLRIICYLNKGNDNISNDLSQGEKSMLSIALLFAIKKYIPWGIVSIDEGSAAFDAHNKSRFIEMIESYSNTIDNLNQIFVVSHDHMFDDISKVIDLS